MRKKDTPEANVRGALREQKTAGEVATAKGILYSKTLKQKKGIAVRTNAHKKAKLKLNYNICWMREDWGRVAYSQDNSSRKFTTLEARFYHSVR